MTTEPIVLVGVLIAGIVGIAALARRAWARGRWDAIRQDAPVIVLVGVGAVVIATTSLDARLMATIAATTSAVVCFLFVLYSRTQRTEQGPGRLQAVIVVLGVFFVAIAVGLLVLAARPGT